MPHDLPPDPKGAAGKLKCPMHLVPLRAVQEVAWALANGAEKYGPFNWRTSKVEMQTYVGALLRHCTDVQERIDLDAESTRYHLAHMAAGCLILLDAMLHGTAIDNRPHNPLLQCSPTEAEPSAPPNIAGTLGSTATAA